MNLNFVERYDLKYHWKIGFQILLKNMILNFIERYDCELCWKIWLWILSKETIMNIISNIYEIIPRLMSSLSFANKSLTISIFPFSTAKNNGVLLNYIILKSYQKIWFLILLKDMILNDIEKYDFKFHWKI